MIRLFASMVLHLLANAVGLFAASTLLDGFTINGTAFLTALLIFTIAETVLGPFVIKVALSQVPALVGGTALISTLAGLIITDVFSDGLTIQGLDTWVLATLIIWLIALVAGLILPLFLFKKTLNRTKTNSEQT